MQPSVSILIPVRNAADTLDEALASLAAQTFTEWEAVVVDDGSTDETPRILAAWEARDPRFRIVRTGARGLVPALNEALRAARAPLLARMDGDDLSLPERLEKQLARMAEGDAALVGCRVRYFPEERVLEGARRYEAWLNSLVTPEEHARDIFVECPIAHPTMLLRAEAVRAVGGYRDRGWPEDYDLVLRLWAAGYRMAKVPEVLLLWRESPARTSRTQPEYRLEAFYRCKAHFLRRTYLAERPAAVFGAGPVGKSLARAVLAEGGQVGAFVEVDPRKIGQRIYDIPVLSQERVFPLRGEVFGLAAVGQPRGRETLRELLTGAGWVEGADFCCAA